MTSKTSNSIHKGGHEAGFGLALTYYFASVLCFDVMGVLVKILLKDYSALELSAYRNIFGIIPSLVLLVWSGQLTLRLSKLYIDQWPLAVFRGIVVAVAQLFLYGAFAHLELATVSALSQTNAFFVVILSVFILKESVGIWRWLALGMGFAGAVMIIRPGTDAFSVQALFPTGAAFCYALSMVTVRLFDRSISNALLYLYSAASAAVAAIILAFATDSFSAMGSVREAVEILAMAISGGCGVLFLMLAYRNAPPSALAPFAYFSLLTAFLWGWVVFGEAPVDRLFPGVLFIVGAGMLILWRENSRKNMG